MSVNSTLSPSTSFSLTLKGRNLLSRDGARGRPTTLLCDTQTKERTWRRVTVYDLVSRQLISVDLRRPGPVLMNVHLCFYNHSLKVVSHSFLKVATFFTLIVHYSKMIYYPK